MLTHARRAYNPATGVNAMLPLSMADRGEPHTIFKIGGKDEVRRHLPSSALSWASRYRSSTSSEAISSSRSKTAASRSTPGSRSE